MQAEDNILKFEDFCELIRAYRAFSGYMHQTVMNKLVGPFSNPTGGQQDFMEQVTKISKTASIMGLEFETMGEIDTAYVALCRKALEGGRNNDLDLLDSEVNGSFQTIANKLAHLKLFFGDKSGYDAPTRTQAKKITDDLLKIIDVYIDVKPQEAVRKKG
jgi:hypothetical protein